jgi:hypothetical protein
MIPRPESIADIPRDRANRRKSSPIRLFVMSVLGALAAVLIFFWADKDRAGRLVDIVRRGVAGCLSTLDPVPRSDKVDVQTNKIAKDANADGAKEITHQLQLPSQPSTLPASESKTTKPRQLEPLAALTEHERLYVSVTEQERDRGLRELSKKIEAASSAAKSGKSRKVREAAKALLAGLREDAEAVLSRRAPSIPDLPKDLFSAGMIGKLQPGAIRVDRVVGNSEMIVRLYDTDEATARFWVKFSVTPLLEMSARNENRRVLLRGVSTEGVVDDAILPFSGTLIVSGTYHNLSGTIYCVEPLKLDAARIQAAFDELARIEQADPVKCELIEQIRTSSVSNLIKRNPKRQSPNEPSLNEETRKKFGPLLADAKSLIKTGRFDEARKKLTRIVEEAPFTDITIESKRLLASLPAN